MKAELDDKGTLTVSAETALESWALARWAELYEDSDERAVIDIVSTVICEPDDPRPDVLGG